MDWQDEYFRNIHEQIVGLKASVDSMVQLQRTQNGNVAKLTERVITLEAKEKNCPISTIEDNVRMLEKDTSTIRFLSKNSKILFRIIGFFMLLLVVKNGVELFEWIKMVLR